MTGFLPALSSPASQSCILGSHAPFLANVSDAGVLVMPCQAYHAVDQSLVLKYLVELIIIRTPKSLPRDSDPGGLREGL